MARPRKDTYKIDQADELARLELYTRLPEAIAETKAELEQINIDIESYDGMMYSNLRKQRSKTIIRLANLERKLVEKNKSKGKAAKEIYSQQTNQMFAEHNEENI